MRLLLTVNPNSGMPIYRQILDQVRHRILSGQIPPGERLPSVRELSALEKINHLTVAKAYQELEREGLLETRRGTGTFVSMSLQALGASERAGKIENSIRKLVLEARHLGISLDELMMQIKQNYSGKDQQ